jgi:6-phosphogluconate dehydrogenase
MSTVQIDKSVIERVIDALKRERVSVLDHGYPIQVASSNVEIALAELRAALATSQAVEQSQATYPSKIVFSPFDVKVAQAVEPRAWSTFDGEDG